MTSKAELEDDRDEWKIRAIALIILVVTIVSISLFVPSSNEIKLQKENTQLKEQLFYNQTTEAYTFRWECWSEWYGFLSGTHSTTSKVLYEKALDYYAEKENCVVKK